MPSSNRGGHPYQRFIPREEVQAVQAWTFAPVDEATLAAQRAQEEAKLRAAVAASEQQLREAHARGFSEGFEQGRQTGAQEMREALEGQLRQQAAEQAQRLASLLAGAQAELEALRQRLADELLALACDLARQVVRRELMQPLPAVRAAAEEALAMLTEDAQPATLRLHPDDWAILQPELDTMLQGRRVQVVADARLTPGGCVLESPLGVIDATLPRRWARALAALGCEQPWADPVEQESADGR